MKRFWLPAVLSLLVVGTVHASTSGTLPEAVQFPAGFERPIKVGSAVVYAPTSSTTTTVAPTTTSSTTTTSTSTTSTTVAATTTTAPSGTAGPPALSAVGPRGNLTNDGRTQITPGTYRNTRFTQSLNPACGNYTFIDVELNGFPAGSTCVNVTLDHVRSNGGLWFDLEPGPSYEGSHNGWRIKWSVIDGGGTQAIRTMGLGSDLIIEDSWFLTAGTSLEGDIHTEAWQSFWGPGGTVTRSAFSVEPRWRPNGTTPITAIINVDGAITFTDSVFGYFNGTSWSAGGGYYAIYPGPNSVWIRPTIYHGGGGYWYEGAPQGSRLVDPVYL